jgi:mersacidin/lichenicidin family type 2 lantibiotic
MNPTDVIRAWTDPEFRARLDPTDRARLPEHPAGLVELDDADLEQVAGGGLCRFGSGW